MRDLHAVVGQAEYTAIDAVVALLADDEVLFLHFGNDARYRRLVLVADLANAGGDQPLGMLAEYDKILCICALIAKLDHLLALQLLDVAMDTEDDRGKLLKTV